MERSTATEILTTIQESESFICKAIAELKGACPEETWSSCARLVGAAIDDMMSYVMVRIWNDYPDLAPDWHDGGFPKHTGFPKLKLRKEARDMLLTAFDAADEKVQSAAARLPQIADPVEREMFKHGLLETSARLSRARVALLWADLEPEEHGSP
jgi:hypothetical protein